MQVPALTIGGTTVTFVSAGTCTINAISFASDGFYATSRSDSIQIINNNTQNVASVKLVDPQISSTQKVTFSSPNINDPYNGTYDLHTCIDLVSTNSTLTGDLFTQVQLSLNSGTYDSSKVTFAPGNIRINASKSLTNSYLSNLYILPTGSTKITNINNSSMYLLIRTNLIADASSDALDSYCDDENRNWIKIQSMDRTRSRTNIQVSRPLHR